MTKIPILDLKAQTRALEEEIIAAFRSVLAETAFIKGPQVREFEGEFASFTGTAHAVGVANGTDALVLALRALGIGPGDEVITTPFSFIASAECVSLVGATPVFADIEAEGFNIDVAAVEARITPRTRAVIGVHLYGQPCDVVALRALCDRRGLYFIEDCAQAAGAEVGGKRIGSFGHFGCFSFFPSKNLGGVGDGGMVTTQDKDMADHIRVLADHGSKIRYHHHEVGCNSRLDSLQAAVLRIKLRHLVEWNDKRRAVAARYTRHFAGSGIVPPSEAPGTRHVYHQYTVRVPAVRDNLFQALNDNGVTAVIYYPVALHLQPVYHSLGYKRGDFPNTERVQDEVLSLPMFPELEDDKVDFIAAQSLELFKSLAASPIAG